MNILAGDIGGTKTLLAIYKWEDGPQKQYHKEYKSLAWDSFDSILLDFINKIPRTITLPSQGCIAVAGLVSNNICKVTNLNWEINSQKILEITNLKSFELINDFCALIYGIKYFKNNQYINIQSKKNTKHSYKDGLVAIIGAGTGLGIARGLITSNEIKVFSSEGGHSEFSPRTDKEWDLSKWLKKDLRINRLAIEKIVSGTGLGNIARWRLMQDDANKHPLRNLAENFRESNQVKIDFSQIASDYANAGDKFMKEALDIWLSSYGSAAGDIALQELCYGGLWLGGGSTFKQLKGIKSSTFLESFKNKGRFKKFVENLPLIALIDPEAGLFSAGCRAYLLANKMGDLN